ncbi:hypothetical protein BDZ45DRAFT_673364 [Acephala macrosclerotiorum]|nr:hypothetical protein BDZ45DRAFT_673364 [Acephala macrosclerotiorum]
MMLLAIAFSIARLALEIKQHGLRMVMDTSPVDHQEIEYQQNRTSKTKRAAISSEERKSACDSLSRKFTHISTSK